MVAEITSPSGSTYNKDINLNVVGTLSLHSDNTISGFSSSNYLYIQKEVPETIDSYELVIKFTTGSDNTSRQFLVAGLPYDGLGSLGFDGQTVRYYLSSNGSSNDIASGSQFGTGGAGTEPSRPATINANTTYEYIFAYSKESGYNFSYKQYTTDGVLRYHTQIHQAPGITEPPYFTGYIGLGCDTGASNTNPFLGTIDLSGSYIKINNEIWWDMYSGEDIDKEEPINNPDVVNGIIKAYPHLGNSISNLPQNVSPYLQIEDDGTMIFKKGLTAYIPNGFTENGTRKFDKVILSEDKSVTYGTEINNLFFSISEDENYYGTADFSLYVSPTEPSSNAGYRIIWYDTTNNIIKTKAPNGTEWNVNKVSLPIGRFSCQGNNKFKLLQAFDYCGYIHTMVFTLPGISGYIAAGLDHNNKPINKKITTNTVYTYTNTDYSNNICNIFIDESGILRVSAGYVSDTDNEMEFYSTTQSKPFYNKSKNLVERWFGGSSTKKSSLQVVDGFYLGAYFSYNESGVTSLTIESQSKFLKSYKIQPALSKYGVVSYPHYLDIEVNGSILTIKKGSTIFYPNGTEGFSYIFDKVILDKDITYNCPSDNYNHLWLCLNIDKMACEIHQGRTYAGSEEPTGTISTFYYNYNEDIEFTPNNFIDKYTQGNPHNNKYSFPLAFLCSIDGNWEIQQVFDWYSYIGHCLIVYPGATEAIPEGLDANGKPITKIQVCDIFSIHEPFQEIPEDAFSVLPQKYYQSNISTWTIGNSRRISTNIVWMPERKTEPTLDFSFCYYNSTLNEIQYNLKGYSPTSVDFNYLPLTITGATVTSMDPTPYADIVPTPQAFKYNLTNKNIDGNQVLYYPQNISPYIQVGQIPLYAYKIAQTNSYIYTATLLPGGLKEADVINLIPFYDKYGNVIGGGKNYTSTIPGTGQYEFVGYDGVNGEDPSDVMLIVKDTTTNSTYLNVIYDPDATATAYGLLVKRGCKYYIPYGVISWAGPTYPSYIEKETKFDMGLVDVASEKTSGLVCISSGFLDPHPQENSLWGNASSSSLSDSINILYHSDTNAMHYRTGDGSWISLTGKYSFPICEVSLYRKRIQGINAIFDSVGYVGNCLFALPGLTTSICYGFDGEKKYNPINSLPYIIKWVNTSYANTNSNIRLTNDFINNSGFSLGDGNLYYNSSDNYTYNNSAFEDKIYATVIGNYSTDSNYNFTSIDIYPYKNYYNKNYYVKLNKNTLKL